MMPGQPLSSVIPRGARYSVPVVHQDKHVIDITIGDEGLSERKPCPIVNPSYGKKSLTRAEAYDLIETLARGLKVIDAC